MVLISCENNFMGGEVEKKQACKFPVLHFSTAANCQLGPGRHPSTLNQYENGFRSPFALFFRTILFFIYF